MARFLGRVGGGLARVKGMSLLSDSPDTFPSNFTCDADQVQCMAFVVGGKVHVLLESKDFQDICQAGRETALREVMHVVA